MVDLERLLKSELGAYGTVKALIAEDRALRELVRLFATSEEYGYDGDHYTPGTLTPDQAALLAEVVGE